MWNPGTRFGATVLFIGALGLPSTGQGLQASRPPLQTTIVEPVARPLYLKVPLAGVEFHWCFVSQLELLSGKLTLEIEREGTTNEIVIFEGGATTPGWRTSLLGSPCAEDALYFLFVSTIRYLTAPGDELELELIVPRDLDGIGAYQTGTLEAGTYRTAGTYLDLRDGPDLPETSARPSEEEFADSMIQAGNTQEEVELALRGRRGALLMQARTPNVFGSFAILGCWENAWPLKITYNEGWTAPEGAAIGANSPDMTAQAESADGLDCYGPR